MICGTFWLLQMQLVAQVWLGSVLACVLPPDQDAPLPMPLESAANPWINKHVLKQLVRTAWGQGTVMGRPQVVSTLWPWSKLINDPFNWQHRSCSLLPQNACCWDILQLSLQVLLFFIIMYHNLFIRSKNMTLKTPLSLNIFWRFLDKELAIIVWTTFQWHSTPQKQQSWKIHLQKGGWTVSKINIFCRKLADLQNMNQCHKVLMPCND